MKNLFIRFSVTLFLISSIMVSCNREDVVKIPDPQLQLEEVKQMMKKDNLTEEEIEILYQKIDALPAELTFDSYEHDNITNSKVNSADGPPVFCVYEMVGVLGNLCKDTNGDGRFIVCVLCEGGVQICPGAVGGLWRHYDSDGNLICAGTIKSNSLVCELCEDGDLQTHFLHAIH